MKPIEIDLPGELRAIAARKDTSPSVADTLEVIADAVEIVLRCDRQKTGILIKAVAASDANDTSEVARLLDSARRLLP